MLRIQIVDDLYSLFTVGYCMLVPTMIQQLTSIHRNANAFHQGDEPGVAAALAAAWVVRPVLTIGIFCVFFGMSVGLECC